MILEVSRVPAVHMDGAVIWPSIVKMHGLDLIQATEGSDLHVAPIKSEPHFCDGWPDAPQHTVPCTWCKAGTPLPF